MDTQKRSWVKAITWRLMGIVVLGSICYAITGDWWEVSLITLLFHGVQLVLYYVHERAWEKIQWGRVQHPLASLPVNGPLDERDLEVIRAKLKELGYLT